MPRPHDPHRPDDDRGCLRLVLAVPLALLTSAAAFCCWSALVIRPSGPWDDEAYAGIVLACVLAVAAAAGAVVLRLLPGVRQVLPWSWLAPALVLGTVAAVRWAALG